MSLSSLLNDQQKLNPFEDDQGAWRQFVLDHLDYIHTAATSYDISPTLMNLYRYDLRRFLTDYLKRRGDMDWIVLLINDLKNDLEFVDITYCVIPEDKVIQDLYHSYITIKSNPF